VTISFQYIASHQDNFTWWEDLPGLAHLNVQAASMTKYMLQTLGAVLAPGEVWSLSLHGMPIFVDTSPEIFDHLSYSSALPY